ncbi:tRNA (guanine-N(7)-)-methyltransferase non-catalytic subunit wdr4 isoform X1 [Hypomesus transpacificus]|uniref:tRNA (guanine-N(7)-)-methyltransferase non-catalytic subunit wdr4 isoform X1 n=1 Tax=Hypomesus transpacificus TaxID=137520 RepID=UPI001F07C552|nr:tRNA (guanine-N(7)-)-methyltransferase non-catalytic subunit wdr4 isoform X1 [Hypomesus transpacificus]
MAVVCVGGEWYLSSCDKLLLAVHTKHNRDPFVFDCSTAENKPKGTGTDNKGHSCASEEKGSDKILAFAVSLSGKLVALTDDNKRLVLFGTEPSWQCISTRWLVRRCTSLVFTQTEDELLAADKSGDVYSLSVVEPRKAGELKLGHLSMLLAMTLSPNDKYVITADRDEKIRVSYLKSPYNIQSFCLGHREFVSSLLVLPMHPHWLLSGSGDGTMKLWEYESGRRIQSWDLKQLRDTPSTQANEERSAVSKIATSPDGCHVAVQCERVPIVQLFGVDQGVEERLTPCSRLTLPHSPLDLTFDLQGRLLVLLDSQVTPFQIYVCMEDRWECDSHCLELSRVSEALKPHWKALQTAFGAAESRFQHLYKVNFDNMSSYLEKKQHRLQQQNENWGKKRRAGKGQQIKQARKKAKSEDKGGDEASS